jgi:hypothetical protein
VRILLIHPPKAIPLSEPIELLPWYRSGIPPLPPPPARARAGGGGGGRGGGGAPPGQRRRRGQGGGERLRGRGCARRWGRQEPGERHACVRACVRAWGSTPIRMHVRGVIYWRDVVGVCWITPRVRPTCAPRALIWVPPACLSCLIYLGKWFAASRDTGAKGRGLRGDDSVCERIPRPIPRPSDDDARCTKTQERVGLCTAGLMQMLH